MTWPFDPSVVLGLLALCAGYAVVARRMQAPLQQVLYFAAGVVVIWAALETPLDPLGDHYLQLAHMVQHMLLMAVAPPLLLLGLTPAMAGLLARIPGLRSITEPVPALCLYAVAILGWHVPFVYDLAITNDFFHIVEHLVFIAVGVLFWWPLIGSTSSASRRRLSDPQKLVYLFVGSFPMMAVALPLQFSRTLFYAPYATVPRLVLSITPVIDQTIAGAVMMAMDMAVLGLDALVILYSWFAMDDEEEGELPDFIRDARTRWESPSPNGGRVRRGG
ncbi:MAG: cytochrome c oxidase assembly protein [Candidatus Dormibacteraeota bacterium]|nr:cytochrome c oxidase assembly protein [Candidatus Dormibacteraeota bacterium]